MRQSERAGDQSFVSRTNINYQFMSQRMETGGDSMGELSIDPDTPTHDAFDSYRELHTRSTGPILEGRGKREKLDAFKQFNQRIIKDLDDELERTKKDRFKANVVDDDLVEQGLYNIEDVLDAREKRQYIKMRKLEMQYPQSRVIDIDQIISMQKKKETNLSTDEINYQWKKALEERESQLGQSESGWKSIMSFGEATNPYLKT